MRYDTAILLDNGTMFGFNQARYEDFEDDCLILTDANGGRISLSDFEVDELYIFLQGFKHVLAEE